MKATNDQQKRDGNENLGSLLVESVSKAGAGDIAIEAAEIALDSIRDEGLFRELPVLGWLKKSFDVCATVRDRIFLKKVANFLAGAGNITDHKREKFLEQIKSEPDFSKKVGESLVLLLERHDDFEKSRILGKVFARYVRGQIEYETFLKIAKAVELAFIGDLNRLPEYYSRIQSYDPKQGKPFTDWVDDQTCQSLYASGLVCSEGWSENTYHPNSVGEELVMCLKE